MTDKWESCDGGGDQSEIREMEKGGDCSSKEGSASKAGQMEFPCDANGNG